MKSLLLGQFIPGDSPVHRLDPRVKILTVLLLSIVILNAGAVESLVVTAFLLAAVALSGLSCGRVAEALKPLSWFFAILFCLHLFFTDGRPIIAALPVVTYEGLELGAAVTWQFVALVVSAAVLTMTTAPSELVGASKASEALQPPRRAVPRHRHHGLRGAAVRPHPARGGGAHEGGPGGPWRRLRRRRRHQAAQEDGHLRHPLIPLHLPPGR